MPNTVYFDKPFADIHLSKTGYLSCLLDSLEEKLKTFESGKAEHYHVAKVGYFLFAINDEFDYVARGMLKPEKMVPEVSRGTNKQYESAQSNLKELKNRYNDLFARTKTALRSVEEDIIRSTFKDLYLFIMSNFLYLPNEPNKSRAEMVKELEEKEQRQKDFRRI